MKKIFTTLFLSCAAYVGSAQIVLLDHDLNVVTNTIIDIPMTAGTSHNEDVLNYNPTSSGKTLKVLRTVMTVDAGDLTQFCWGGLCYGFTTNLSSLSATVPAMDTIGFEPEYGGMGFHAIFNSSAVPGTRLVHYKFYDTSAPTDTASVTLRYNIVAGVNDLAKNAGSISNAFPNPANTMVSVKYEMKDGDAEGKIVFHDMLGKMVKEVSVTEKAGTAKVNVSELNAGIYFYSFVINDKVVGTRKLVISNR